MVMINIDPGRRVALSRAIKALRCPCDDNMAYAEACADVLQEMLNEVK